MSVSLLGYGKGLSPGFRRQHIIVGLPESISYRRIASVYMDKASLCANGGNLNNDQS